MVAPDVFTGELEERQPMEFLQALERHCMEVGCEDYYGSRAYNWYTNTLTDEQREDSWEEFSKLFNAKFPSLQVYRDELLASRRMQKLQIRVHTWTSCGRRCQTYWQQRVGNEYDNWSQFTAAIEDIQWSTLEAAIDYQEEMWRMIITQMGTHDGKTRSEKERGVQLKVD
ncbi:hypothetical protein BDP27DRAFT_1320092 [Rhodocollybia butyracea]|uniref:Retrotransposon gag domain-containing protein n=1 Tax=Rhodocollybia butyracea TaxID=206335 RepID=A0A9P5PUU0_9AGAR|nr:hypothetical protein BDP27DRAFT_1320092 [Rhodocollybia butyracea]